MKKKLEYTKVYFYGATKEEARESCDIFLDLLSIPELKTISTICVFDFNDPNPPLPCYKWRCYCEYVKTEHYYRIKMAGSIK